MTARNGALAGQLLQELYSAALDAAGPDMQARLRTALAACFERGPSEPAYVAALQRIALADRGAAGSVAIPAAAAAAKASGGLQAGVLQVGHSFLNPLRAPLAFSACNREPNPSQVSGKPLTLRV